jgi:hypothetical protein
LGAAPLQDEHTDAEDLPMTAPRPNAAKPRPLEAVLALRDRHDRQRELVRASLVTRPTAPSPTHRRSA